MVTLFRLAPFALLAGCMSAPAPVASEAGDAAVFVANKRGNTLTKIDFATGEKAIEVPSCRNPHELAVSPDGLHVALACYGHVLGYVFQEHALAGKVLERAVAQNPSQAFAWDHLALHKLYCGDYDHALQFAQKATQLGAYSPLSYSYDTTLSMAATLAGDYGRATVAGLSAMQKQPRFKASLRYLMIAQSALGQRDAAEQTRDRLLRADPDFIRPDVRLVRFGIRNATEKHPVLFHLKTLME